MIDSEKLTFSIGAQKNEESPIVRRQPPLARLIFDVATEKSLAISSAAINNEVLLKVAANVIQLVMKTNKHFFHIGVSK